MRLQLRGSAIALLALNALGWAQGKGQLLPVIPEFQAGEGLHNSCTVPLAKSLGKLQSSPAQPYPAQRSVPFIECRW